MTKDCLQCSKIGPWYFLCSHLCRRDYIEAHKALWKGFVPYE